MKNSLLKSSFIEVKKLNKGIGMYAVIFKAKIKLLDELYESTATRMRALAIEKYHCRDFVSLREGDQEIAISYWDNMADIRAWKQDATHIKAQQLGAERWYLDYQVQITKIEKEYAKER